MVRMGACRVPDRGSIPRRGDFFLTQRNEIVKYERVTFRAYEVSFIK